MRTRGRILLVVALCLTACGDTNGPTEDDVDAASLQDAAAAEDLPAALDAGERLVEELLADLDVDPRERPDVRPYRVSPCDVVDDDAPSLVSVARGIAFPAERTDDVIEQVRTTFEAAGVDGIRVVREDSDMPAVIGVFAEQTWQVGATLNAVDGIGEIRVNSRCLPGELPEPPASS